MITLTRIPLILVACSLPFGSLSGQVFSEDFDHLQALEQVTTSNTNLTYARTGVQGGGIAAQSPSSFSGASALITGPTGGSLNGIGASDTLPASSIYSMSFAIRLENTTGNIVFGAGTGTSFTANSTFTTGHGLFWYQIDAGVLQHRDGSSWLDTGQHNLIADTNLHFHVVANGSLLSVSYAERTLLARTMDFYLNGELIYGGIPVTNSDPLTDPVKADGFRIYSVSGANFEVDNITLWNSAQPIPEPATYAALLGCIVLATTVFFRRRLRVN